MTKLNFVENGVLRLPPGFRFHPTDEELVVHYLYHKVQSLPMTITIPEADVCRSDPWDLPGDLDQERYFFSTMEIKYPNGKRSNRTTTSGYWKATGLDKRIIGSKNKQVIGTKKSLVFYRGKPPHGSKTNWIMHEYKLASHNKDMGNWVLCRMFLKKTAKNGGMKDEEEMVKVEKSTTRPVLYEFIGGTRKFDLNLEGDASSSCSSGVTKADEDENSIQSKFDQASKISKSVFVFNFPEGCTPKDLWKVCNDYDTVVDVFILNKKSKAGKRFAFVRFIKMIRVLLNATCRNMLVINGSSTAADPGPYISSASALVLDDSCVVERDLSKYAMGKVKDVNSVPNLRTLLMDEGFFDVKLKYLEAHSPFSEEVSGDDSESDVEEVSETIFGDKSSSPNNNSDEMGFTLEVYEIRKENDQGAEEFSSLVNAKVMNNSQEVYQEINRESVDLNIVKEGGLGHKKKKEWIKELSLKNNINFMAIQETKTNCISHMDVKFMWDNSNYNYVYNEAVGNSSGRWNGETIILGDFNEVRSIDERRGSCFNPSSARVFDHFISSSGLVDVKLKGYAFTWSRPSGSKMSKLDRFLVSECIFSIVPSITALCLDRHLSDHRPILHHEVYSDFGPIPFRFYHSWFSLEGFDAMVEQTWRSFSHFDVNMMIRFKKKLQDLKAIIRCWVKDKRMHRRLELQRKLHDINQMEAKDSFQKSKIKWAIEGDENSKFFQGMNNKKRSQLAIRGVFDNGVWCTDSGKVKEAFFNRFEARFKKPVAHRFMLNFPFNKRLSDMQAADLERNVSRDDIWLAVWNCGENKSPVDEGLFKGVYLQGSIFISHLFYADDAMCIEEWSDANLKGDGNETRFWYDKWIGDKSLQVLFPQLFALELDKEVLVADKMKAVVGHSCRRPVRAGSEHQQMVDLNSLLESVSFAVS
nr:NAC domain-containing protein 83-like [Tanacetum cinerariifolium]